MRTLTMRLCTIMLLLAASLAPSPVLEAAPSPRASVDEDARAPGRSGPSASEVAARKHPKLDSSLVGAAQAARAGVDVVPAAERRGVQARDGLLRVEIESHDLNAARTMIAALGGRVEGEYANLIQALVPPASLDQIAADPAIVYVRPARSAHPEAVNGEGAGASGAASWHAAGQSGAGTKVGVIDSDFAGYQARQASGDLPATLVTQNYCPGGLENGSAESHGTAVAEVVYEMAPAAQLYLICAGTSVEKGLALQYAKAQGIQIVNNSSGAFNTGRGDGSGGPGTAEGLVADARANGILWVNSAGNYAQRHWSGIFNDTDDDGAHNYSPIDEGNTFVIPAGGSVVVYLKWDAWPTTNQDFDLYLVTSLAGTTVSWSESFQDGSQRPTEALAYTNTTGSTQDFFVEIYKYSASTAPRMDVFVLGDTGALQYTVPEGSLNDYASSPHSFAAAAICWQNSQLEPYSSRGPTIDGRVKPDVSGLDSVSSATYGEFGGCGASGFTGTSSAAPHVAGAAALVKAANPGFGPDQLQAFLEARAADLGQAGKDTLFGAGRLALGATPLLPIACSPRPPVRMNARVESGRLVVTAAVTDPANRLLSITFGANGRVPVGALLDLPDGRIGVSGATSYSAPDGATEATFAVRRASGGQPATVPLIVADRCGTWETFVGGGTAAGF